MGYFEDHYLDFRYPLKTDAHAGFRPAQLGAIHSAAAHFTMRTDPGIITMPTGSGKTAVLVASAFVLRAKRVLIIAPNRLVREQIVEEVQTLGTLKEVGAVDDGVPGPTVANVKKRITSADEWEKLREFDVVVGMTQSISPSFDAVPNPPADLFDLVLVDEAHHSPARTWQAVLNQFPDANRLLFTATPFRQDQREIKGRFIFTYDLRRAFEDGVYGEIVYRPVTVQPAETSDVAIARAAEAQFRADEEAGREHRLMVRTDSRARAQELANVYQASTSLRLKVITGDKSLRFLKGVIAELDGGELDGIICVNMMGEGFDFPSLKIAAIHSPHRSLAVTLQFIGRFARTTGENTGPATFLAVPSEIEIEAERMYDTRAVWQDMVQNLSAARVSQEARTREVLESFNPTDMVAQDLSDLSLYVLEPYYHVKVYQLEALVDIGRPVAFPDELQIVYESVSEEHNAAVYITREISLPRWTSDDRLAIVQPDLFIFFQDPTSRLLFICASRRVDGLYEQLSSSFGDANPRQLPLVRLNRALNDLGTPEFFNVGMRNRVASSTTESYRIITGSNADKAILKSDGRLYHRGHVFGRASDAGDLVTIGLSSSSKIWSNKSSRLPELIAWCEKLAERINSDRVPMTGSGLDYLDVGEEIDALPPGIIGVTWPVSVFRSPPVASFEDLDGTVHRVQLLDFDISVDRGSSTETSIIVRLTCGDLVAYNATFSFETDRFFEAASQNEPALMIERERESVPIIDFLNGEMPAFHTAEMALVHGYSYLRPAADVPPLDLAQVEPVDWAADNVDIEREFGTGREGRLTIHQWLANKLAASDATVVYYDHGTGEIADFVAVTPRDIGLLVQFYHCKGSSGAAAGHRVDDVYELGGQVVKSVVWALRQRVLSHIRRRFGQNIGSHQFIKGDLDTLTDLLNENTPAQIEFEYIAVQPGIQKDGLPNELINVLAASNDHLVRAGFKPIRVIASGSLPAG